MSDAGDFVDAALQLEASRQRALADEARIGTDLKFYGASVGAVRGTIRDVGHRYPGLGHDEITALSSELWRAPVFERRLAAIVLLQSHVGLLDNSDLTRLEGFLREARTPALDRWSADANPWLRRAALVSPLRAFRAGGGDWDAFARRACAALEVTSDDEAVREAVRGAVSVVTDELARTRPDLAADIRSLRSGGGD